MSEKYTRWYDKHPPLGGLLDKLKDKKTAQLNKIIRGLRDLIASGDPDLIDKTVMHYPLVNKRRWYDVDPMHWMTINALHFASDALVAEAIAYLKKNLRIK